jgi:hypothetical protein
VIRHRQRSRRSAANNRPKNVADACCAADVHLHTVAGFTGRQPAHRGFPSCCTVSPLMRLLHEGIEDDVSESRDLSAPALEAPLPRLAERQGSWLLRDTPLPTDQLLATEAPPRSGMVQSPWVLLRTGSNGDLHA